MSATALIGPEQVATMLDVSVRVATRLMAGGDIPSKDLGKGRQMWRTTEANVLKWMAGWSGAKVETVERQVVVTKPVDYRERSRRRLEAAAKGIPGRRQPDRG